MQTEIEAKFLDIDHAAMRQRLQELGAELIQPERLMRRVTFDFPDKTAPYAQGGWLRVRDEGDKVTMSYKQNRDTSLTGTQEAEVIVEDFEAAADFLRATGYIQKSYQETKRESWNLAGVQIELDQWPWVHPFIEIEGGTEDEVRQAATKLGLDWPAALHGSVAAAYQAEYDVSEGEVNTWPEITFTPVPADLAAKRR